MKAIYKCPHCDIPTDYVNKEFHIGKGEEEKIKKSKLIIVRRVKDDSGNIIWKNLFYMKITDIFFLVSIILLLLGFWQIHTQCKDYLQDPCDFAAKTHRCLVTNISIQDAVPSYANLQIPATSLPSNP